MVYSLSGGDWICGWEADKLEVCSLSICHVKNQTYLVGTVDDMGKHLSYILLHMNTSKCFF